MSSEASSDIMPGVEIGIGALLRQKREAMGWRLEDVADHLRIRASILKGLEEEDYDTLPGRVYLLGFLRNYVSFLGLDAEKILTEFSKKDIKEPVSSRVKISDVSFVQDQGSHSTPIGVFLGIGFLLTLGVYGGWYYMKGHDISFHHIARPIEHSVETLKDKAVSSGGEEHKEVPPLEATEPTEATKMTALGEENKMPSQQSTSLPNMVIPSEETASSPFVKHDHDMAEEKKASSGSDSLNASANDMKMITLCAQEESWVSIKDSKNKNVFSGILKKGAQWQGEDAQGPYFLTTGNAGGVYFKLGTMQTPPLGSHGVVRHDIKITAAQIMSGSFGALSSGTDLEHHNDMH